MNNSRAEKLINIWYFITVFVLLIVAVKFALPLFLPFLLATIVAVLINKPINYLSQKFKIKRKLISFFSIAFITVLLISLLSLLIYSIYAYLSDVLIKLPELLPKLTVAVKQISDIFSNFTNKMPDAVTDALSQLPANIISTATASLTSTLTATAKALPNLIIAIGATVFASFLISSDYYKLGNFLNSVLPESAIIKLRRYKAIVGNKSFGMLKGYAVLTAITYVILLVGFIIIGVDYAPAVATIVAFIDLLPILGTGFVLIPWAIISIFNGQFYTAIVLVIIYIIATVSHNALSPKVLGNQIKLDSLTVLISMYVGYGLFGIMGLIFAPFIAAIIRDILMEQ